MILDRSGYTVTAEARGGKKLGEEIESFRGKGAGNAHALYFLCRFGRYAHL